ncbi:MAG: ATP synthase F1 subunit delta [Candidatus Omnitrophica bacterium]|nr:ATP synthase F1 subunit delta [Candidatus Omnitrophota bacterium]
MSQSAHRYAQALFDLSREENNLQPVQDALIHMGSLILDLEDFQLFLKNPLLSVEERGGILKALFEGKVPDLVLRFLLFITYKNRLSILQEIIEAFDVLYLSGTHQLRALIQTAFPVNDEDKIFISRCLQDTFGQHMIPRWDMDPSLVGGFRIYAQGRVYDYGFKSQLNHFLQQTTSPVC